MAKYLQLDIAKKHLVIDAGFTADDDYIRALMDVAEASVEKHLDIKLAELAGENGGELPAPVVHAMLYMVGNLYANREPVTVGVSSAEMPLSYRYLIGLYQRHTVG